MAPNLVFESGGKKEEKNWQPSDLLIQEVEYGTRSPTVKLTSLLLKPFLSFHKTFS